MPVMKPVMTASEMKLVIQPMRSRPATMNTTPVVRARAAVKATAVLWSPPEIPPTTLAEMAATEPAAANTSSFEPPNMA